MRNLTEIIIHTSATADGWMADKPIADKVAEIDRWHRDRGWSGIGYHYVIDRNGAVASGRALERDGAHVKGHNKGTVGICLVGGATSSATDRFADNYTPQQDEALRKLIGDLQRTYRGIKKITGHNQYAAKACPGFDVPRWLARKPAAGDGVVEFLKGSKDAKVVAVTGTLGTLSQVSGDVKTLFADAYEILGFSPWWIIIGGVGVFWLLTRWNKWQRGVR